MYVVRYLIVTLIWISLMPAAAKSHQSCPTLQPHRQQATRLRSSWDSPGKNTGVGCHFLLQCMKVKSESEVAQSCPTLRYLMDCSLPGSSIHGLFQARVLECLGMLNILFFFLFVNCVFFFYEVSFQVFDHFSFNCCLFSHYWVLRVVFCTFLICFSLCICKAYIF